MVAGLNRATGKQIGVYPEIKRPGWHQDEGFDITAAILEELKLYGYEEPGDAIFLQCFDAAEVRRIRHDLGCRLKLVQLIGENEWRESDTDYERLRSDQGLAELAGTVDAIGPWLRQLYAVEGRSGEPVSTGMTERAREAGLQVHPYTFRADEIPDGFPCFEELMRFFIEELAVDGVFTDFPDRVHRLLLEPNG